MPLDPQIAGLLSMLEASGAPPMSQGTPQAARDGFRMLTVGLRDPAALPPVASVEDRELPGGVRVRLYRPERSGETTAAPTVVFLHGGGFVIGDLDTHDDQARLVTAQVGAVVLSVDYRLAPEHPWPAGLEDCLAATRWALAHAGELGGDPARVAVAGDSAGGNLSAAVALQLRGEDGPGLAAQLLLYPATDFTEQAAHPSRGENATGSSPRRTCAGSATSTSRRARTAATPACRCCSRATCLAGDLSGLPPAVVGTAEYDPLRDEGEAYAKALEAAGVPVRLHRYPGLIHGFFGFGLVSPAAAAANRELCADLKDLLG